MPKKKHLEKVVHSVWRRDERSWHLLLNVGKMTREKRPTTREEKKRMCPSSFLLSPPPTHKRRSTPRSPSVASSSSYDRERDKHTRRPFHALRKRPFPTARYLPNANYLFGQTPLTFCVTKTTSVAAATTTTYAPTSEATKNTPPARQTEAYKVKEELIGGSAAGGIEDQ